MHESGWSRERGAAVGRAAERLRVHLELTLSCGQQVQFRLAVPVEAAAAAWEAGRYRR